MRGNVGERPLGVTRLASTRRPGSLSGRQLGIEAAPQRCTTAMKKYAFVGLAEAQQITDLTRWQTLDISQADHEPLAL
jgi:hypothetical protein